MKQIINKFKNFLNKAKQIGVKIHLPIDVVAGKRFNNNTEKKIFDVMDIMDNWEAMDAGPKSEKKFHELIFFNNDLDLRLFSSINFIIF